VTPAKNPDAGLVSNVCRNPDGKDTIWCFTSDAGTSELPLVNKGKDGQSSGLLQQCEGDCDKDAHCAPGLVCHSRDDNAKVPFCLSGGIGDTKDTDYCTLPSTAWAYCDPIPTPSPTPSPTPAPTATPTSAPSPVSLHPLVILGNSSVRFLKRLKAKSTTLQASWILPDDTTDADICPKIILEGVVCSKVNGVLKITKLNLREFEIEGRYTNKIFTRDTVSSYTILLARFHTI
jgi:hypothetical protein